MFFALYKNKNKTQIGRKKIYYRKKKKSKDKTPRFLWRPFYEPSKRKLRATVRKNA